MVWWDSSGHIIELRSNGANQEQVEHRQMAQSDVQTEVQNHVIHISKEAGRTLADDVIQKFVDQMISAVNTSGRIQRGWKLSLRPVAEGSTEWYRIEYLTQSMTGPRKYHLFFDLTGKNTKSDGERESRDAATVLDAKGASFGGKPFVVDAIDGEKWEQSAESRKAGIRGEGGSDIVGYAPFNLPDNWSTYFTHLFGLDAQIRRVIKTVKLAEETDFRKRV